MKPKDLQNVIEIRKKLIEQSEGDNLLYLEDAYQWVIDAPEEEREDRLFAAVTALKTKRHYIEVYDWVFKGLTQIEITYPPCVDGSTSI